MSLSFFNSTVIPLVADSSFIGSNYDNILDFAEINIAINCDTGYELTYFYSQDKINIDYQTSQNITAQATTQFYNVQVKDKYFKLKIKATDGTMGFLNLQTIYKSVPTYKLSSGPSANVVITEPLNLDGSVFVGGSFDISGQTVLVDISGQTVDISGQTVLVDISGQTVDISGQTVLVDISGQSVVVSGTVTTDVYGLLNNQRLSSQVWAGVSVAQNETSSAITPSLSSYCNTVLSCYGSSTEDAVIAVQFSNDATTFYTTQYQYTLLTNISHYEKCK
jgi:hypothetical protein